MPTSVQLGDEFDLVITMTNQKAEPVYIWHIVLDEIVRASILDGTTVISTNPTMDIDPIYSPQKVAYSYFRTITPGETQMVVFHLGAEIARTYGGTASAYASTNPFTPFAFFIDPVTISIAP